MAALGRPEDRDELSPRLLEEDERFFRVLRSFLLSTWDEFRAKFKGLGDSDDVVFDDDVDDRDDRDDAAGETEVRGGMVGKGRMALQMAMGKKHKPKPKLKRTRALAAR